MVIYIGNIVYFYVRMSARKNKCGHKKRGVADKCRHHNTA